ncbi:tyrosine-type recombinase/integrase [Roseimicrobium sp. ORNL1]|uniref:tyrosine-type recombinase/integrase n=1 Tax=Roseimicrobium sp. ORNL1 TaxID=2711231 RepID=UPI0013E1ACDC|nr:tyrosine-type recombinase/integrase [Roseimicrobium sp. ORNL1]QIF02898.1 tyrosine-type recombinase/integrase [Roseimicrobium sp. ORNL1]
MQTKEAAGVRRFAKTDYRHWLERVDMPGRCLTFGVHLSYRGRRMRFSLETANKDAAAKKAARLYLSLVAKGWDETLKQFRPEKAPKPPSPTTVGLLLTAVQNLAEVRVSTLRAYSQAIRTIASDVAAIRSKHARGKSKGRADSLNTEEWRRAVDALSLDLLSPATVADWRRRYIERAGDAPDARRRAENSASALIRNARSLFSKRTLRTLLETMPEIVLPDPLPFSGMEVSQKVQSYKSRVDPTALVNAGLAELAGNPAKLEQFKILMLGLLCGLRKAEVDTLQWRQVDVVGGTISIETTEHFQPKSHESEATVALDEGLAEMMKEWKKKATGPFVIESQQKPNYHKRKNAYYRANVHFRRLAVWLKAHGVDGRKPIHQLRKECGSIIATSSGILAAKSVLRHSTIDITAKFYADHKKRVTTGLGSLLVPPTSALES